jgi:cytochrome c556
MKLVRSMMLFAAAVLVGAVTITAQGGQKQWTDEAYDKVMKEVGATAGAMRKAIDGQNAELAKTNATKMVSLFTDVHAFWMARNVKEAATIANSALTHAKAVEGAIDAKDFTKAAESAKTMQGTCAECHKTYRDKGPDGAWRIKP